MACNLGLSMYLCDCILQPIVQPDFEWEGGSLDESELYALIEEGYSTSAGLGATLGLIMAITAAVM